MEAGCIEDACQNSVCQEYIRLIVRRMQVWNVSQDVRRVNWNRCEVEEECQECEG